MIIYTKYSPLSKFDFSILNDPEFKEDAVREEIITPILKALGYSATGNNRIIRSRQLKHSFVSVGSQRKEITLVPDYVLEIDNCPAWILEAKSPSKKLLSTGLEEQAYSYAIHPEIRAKYYALCNGIEFLLYSVNEYKPVLHFALSNLAVHWEELKRILSPTTLDKNVCKKLAKDFGLHIKRLGLTPNFQMFFYDVPLDFIAKISNNLYTFCTNKVIDDCEYCISFDFDYQVALQFGGKIPNDALALLLKPLESNSGRQIEFTDCSFRVNIACVLSEDLQENQDEIFLPMKVVKVF